MKRQRVHLLDKRIEILTDRQNCYHLNCVNRRLSISMLENEPLQILSPP